MAESPETLIPKEPHPIQEMVAWAHGLPPAQVMVIWPNRCENELENCAKVVLQQREPLMRARILKILGPCFEQTENLQAWRLDLEQAKELIALVWRHMARQAPAAAQTLEDCQRIFALLIEGTNAARKHEQRLKQAIYDLQAAPAVRAEAEHRRMERVLAAALELAPSLPEDAPLRQALLEEGFL